MIVAPWWQWTDPETQPPGKPVDPRPLDGRLSRPIFQKYDSPDLVNEFLKDPQHCLKFIDDDLVHSLQGRRRGRRSASSASCSGSARASCRTTR